MECMATVVSAQQSPALGLLHRACNVVCHEYSLALGNIQQELAHVMCLKFRCDSGMMSQAVQQQRPGKSVFTPLPLLGETGALVQLHVGCKLRLLRECRPGNYNCVIVTVVVVILRDGELTQPADPCVPEKLASHAPPIHCSLIISCS